MKDAELIKKIQLLNKIEPDKDWAFSVKSQILGVNEPSQSRWESLTEIFRVLPRFSLRYQPVFALLAVIAVFAGVIGVSQLALPGDALYSVKRMSEKGISYFSPRKDLTQVSLETANKRLDELTQVAQANKVKNLAPAINEFQASMSEAAKNINNISKLTKEIVQETEKLQENQAKVEAMGVAVGESKDLNSALGSLVEREINDLESRSLTAEQAKALEGAKEDFQKGDFNQALEKLLILSYPQP